MWRIYGVCREMVVRVHRLVVEIAPQDPALADQLNRSSNRVKDNVAEGAGVRGGNRRVHYQRAIGSTYEARSQIETAVDKGYVDSDPVAVDQLDHIAATLYKIVK